MFKKPTLLILFISFVGIIGLIRIFSKQVNYVTHPDSTDEIRSFEECSEAGNPVMESYPRRCNADGKTFTENIGNELEMTDVIRTVYPRPNQLIASPLNIQGEARGTWYFEASFPVYLTDAYGNRVASGIATSEGEWMTENFVPYTAVILFDLPTTDTGELVLEKSNPSGLAENADKLRIPIRFN